jgi:hypothetical protein
MMDVEDWPNLYSKYAKAEVVERDQTGSCSA